MLSLLFIIATEGIELANAVDHKEAVVRSKCTECEVFCVYCEVDSFVINKEISGIYLSLGNGLITKWGLIFRCILFDG